MKTTKTMSGQLNKTDGPEQVTELEPEQELDPEVRAALAEFCSSVNAWSEAAISRPRLVASSGRAVGWRLALGAALCCVLAAGTLAAVVAHRHIQNAANRVAGAGHTVAAGTVQLARTTVPASDEQMAAAEHDLVMIEDQMARDDQQDLDALDTSDAVQSDEQLLAAVDKDVARQVPSAMEALQQMGEETSSQTEKQ